jgi:aprataxin
MKRQSSDLLLCRVLDAKGVDRYGKLEGLAFEFDGQTGSVTPSVAGAWQVRSNGSAWRALEAYTEYELRDGMCLRNKHNEEYRVALVVFEDKGKQAQPEVKKAKAEPPAAAHAVAPPPKAAAKLKECNYGAECYRLQNAEHCALFSHPGVNDLNRARPKIEHHLADQIMPDWDKEEAVALEWEDEEKPPPQRVESLDAPVSNNADQLHVLAFPSISTATFEFEVSKAMAVLVEEASEFLRIAPPSVQLVLCDISDSAVLKLAAKLWAARHGGKDLRFRVAVVDLTRVNSSGHVGATVVVNSTNKDLSPNGSGINQALYKAVPHLAVLTATQNHLPPARVGQPMVVELPEDNAWRAREGVVAVVHILGPNMNKSRPDCLNGDYERGCEQLAITYRNLFISFLNRTRLLPERIPLVEQQSPVKPKKKETVETGDASGAGGSGGGARAGLLKYFNSVPKKATDAVAPGPAASVAMPAAASVATAAAPTAPASFLAVSAQQRSDEGASAERSSGKPKGGWSYALLDMAMHPEKYGDAVVFCDNRVVAVRDKFPKARLHVLVMPRRQIDDFGQLVPGDVELLRYMEDVGREVQRTLDPQKKLVCRMGYHAVPSMKQVHMHVISQDFESDALKNKKHWNSFTTRFFVDSKKLIAMLEDEGAVFFDRKEQEDLLSLDLKCCRCGAPVQNMPTLKQHLLKCRK